MVACAYAIRVLLTCIDRQLSNTQLWRIDMRYLAKAVLVAAVVLLPALSHAQSLAGTVRDASGAVLPGVTVEAASPVLIEKVRTATTDGSRPVSNRESAARHLLVDLHASRIHHRQARWRRAQWLGRADDQLRDARRRHSGNHHRHR